MALSRARVVTALVGAVVVGGVVAGVLRNAHERFSIWYPSAVALAVIGGALLVRVAWRPSAPPALAHGEEPDAYELPGMLRPLEQRVGAAQRHRGWYRHELQPVLVDVARARAARRNVSWDDARPLLGEEAWQWLTTTQDEGPAPNLTVLNRVVRAIEQL